MPTYLVGHKSAGSVKSCRRSAAGSVVGVMLQALHKLFASKTPEPEPPGGKVTLGDVLRRDWFELWYQPKIDLRSKRLVGAEGLYARAGRTAA